MYYQIIWGTSTSDLSEKVRQELEFGWKLQGGVSAIQRNLMGSKDWILLQAMVKEK